MSFTTPIGLLGLLAVPLVVFVHLYRRRLPQRQVAALFLFPHERLATGAGRTRTRLLRTPSFWCELLAALLLGLWLGGPSFGGAAARHVVVVLDDSASMAAGAAERGRVALRERARSFGSGDRITVLRTGPQPEVLVGPNALPSELGAALARWRPARPRHDPRPALDLARELAGGTGEAVFVTDEAAPAGFEDIAVLAFGEALPNSAILTAARGPRTTGDGEELRLRIGGFGAVLPLALVVRDESRELARTSAELVDGKADLVVPLPVGAGAVCAALGADALALDDEAWLLPAPDRTVAIVDRLAPEARAALELPRVFQALRGFRFTPDPSQAQLRLSAGPGALVAGQTEIVITADGERDAWRGPFVLDKGHPWLDGLQLQGVYWQSGRGELPGQVLAAVGGKALLSEEFLDAGRRLWIDLDPSAGNVTRAPDWPLLLANVLDSCRAEVPGPAATNLVIGDEARWRRALVAGGADTELTLVGPDGGRRPGRPGRTAGWLVDQPGLHRVLGAGDAELGRFAVRFVDPAESDLRTLRTFTTEGLRPPAVADGPLRDTSIEQRVLMLVLLVCVVIDWWLLGRGRA
jgi:hypothetical protein